MRRVPNILAAGLLTLAGCAASQPLPGQPGFAIPERLEIQKRDMKSVLDMVDQYSGKRFSADLTGICETADQPEKIGLGKYEIPYRLDGAKKEMEVWVYDSLDPVPADDMADQISVSDGRRPDYSSLVRASDDSGLHIKALDAFVDYSRKQNRTISVMVYDDAGNTVILPVTVNITADAKKPSKIKAAGPEWLVQGSLENDQETWLAIRVMNALQSGEAVSYTHLTLPTIRLV